MDVRRWAIAAACVLASVGGARAQSAASALENGAAASTVQRVEIAFCVDCSGSMGPAMNAAKHVIVDIARRHAATSPGASVRVGILRYGDGDRRFQLLPLTERLDAAIEFLNRTRIDSGKRAQEPVGTFLRKAIADMGWTNGKAVRRYLYVVGNEAPQQGSNTYQRGLANPARRTSPLAACTAPCSPRSSGRRWRSGSSMPFWASARPWRTGRRLPGPAAASCAS